MSAIILCYHKVGPQNDEGRRLNVTPRRLESHVGHFKRRGYEFLRAKDFSKKNWPERAVCFTFDDAYWSTVEFGLTVFDKFCVPATLYAVSSLVGHSSSWDSSSSRPLADWESLRGAQQRGHEIGNHTHRHLKLSELDLDSQIREIQWADEILRSQGINPSSFCYPYGNFNSQSLEALRICGYEVGLALKKRVATAQDDRMALPRIVVGFSDALPMLLYKIHLRPKLRRG